MCVLLVNSCTVNLVCEECKKANGSVCGPVGMYILTREFQPLGIIIPHLLCEIFEHVVMSSQVH